jgi:beta-glucosidase/6-phospho-beta-glucosidase/beta-galactosidase
MDVNRILNSRAGSHFSGGRQRARLDCQALDTFEWMPGYEPKFGMVAVDLKTRKRTIKPSAAILGVVAKRNSL